MSLIRYLGVLVMMLSLSSCSKFSYIVKQGWGQLKLQYNGIDNKEALQSKEIPEEFKRKILLVEDAKKFFENYFDYKTGDIYSKTTILDRDAVSYLVIASPVDRIEAMKFSFPIVGEFPYIGFFSKSDAIDFANDLKSDGMITFIRPVYAYSTLGKFTDRILSSFFVYDDIDLVETIFHELFHTVFFIENEVDLNENLANYVGQELAVRYFNLHSEQKETYLSRLKRDRTLGSTIVKLAKKADNILQTSGKKGAEAQQVFSLFLEEHLYPELIKLCPSKDCKWLQRDWNQATLASYMTYEEKQDVISEGIRRNNIALETLPKYLKLTYENYKKEKLEISFEKYLESKLNAPLLSH